MSAKSLTERGIYGEFYNALDSDPGKMIVDQLSFRVGMDTDVVPMKWIGQVPQMREMLGSKLAHGFNDYSFDLRAKKYESTIEVPRDIYKDQQAGLFDIRIRELAQIPSDHRVKLMMNVLINNDAAYDGTALVANSRSFGESGTIDNIHAFDLTTQSGVPTDEQGNTTNPSPKSMAAAINFAISKIRGFLSDRGEPMNESAGEFVVICNSVMQNAAEEAAIMVNGMGDNSVLIGGRGKRVRVYGSARLDSTFTDKFFVARADGVAKPFILGVREEPFPEFLEEGSEYAKIHHMLQWSVVGRHVVAPGEPRHIVQIDIDQS